MLFGCEGNRDCKRLCSVMAATIPPKFLSVLISMAHEAQDANRSSYRRIFIAGALALDTRAEVIEVLENALKVESRKQNSSVKALPAKPRFVL